VPGRNQVEAETTTSPNVDSRSYIIAYELCSRDDVPPDFGPRSGFPEFDAGVFLPRGEPDWFGRSKYPPRAVALLPGGIFVVPHPTANVSRELLRFDQLSFVESGHILLKGWLRFVGRDFDRTLCYNTRSGRAMDLFMRRLRIRTLSDSDSSSGDGLELGAPLDLKFRYALSHELDASEAIRGRFFRPPVQLIRRRFGLKRARTIPADLVAITTSRLLWITDRDGSGRADYGSIVRYARLSDVQGISRSHDGHGSFLAVTLGPCGAQWRIPLSPEHWHDAAWFESAIRSNAGCH
jgi:hypothetical protein